MIQIVIANLNVRRVLIDNGSSANLLFASTVKAMHLDETKIRRKSVSLIGFSGESKSTLGEIDLMVYAGGKNLCTTFMIINSCSAYNAILGRPWLHYMKAVPSTYHQVVKFPTENGMGMIMEEQKQSRECYFNALKSKAEEL